MALFKSFSAPRCLLWACGWLLSMGLLVASSAAAQPFHAYTADTGLPTNLVKAVVQDSTGTLWIGTDRGVASFNGNRIQEVEEPLLSSRVKDLHLLNNDSLLVVTDLGVNLVTNLRDSAVVEVVLQGRKTLTDSTLLYPKSVYKDRRGTLWLGGAKAIVRIENGSFRRYWPDSTRRFWADHFSRSFRFTEDGNGRLVAAAHLGALLVYDRPADQFRRVPLPPADSSFRISDIRWSTADSTLLLGTRKGVYTAQIGPKFRLRQWERRYNVRNVSSIHPHPIEGLVMGTWGQGLHHAPSPGSAPQRYAVPPKTIQEVVVSQNGAILMATDTGIGVLPRQFFDSVPLPAQGSSHYIRDLALAPDGQPWGSRAIDLFTIQQKDASFTTQRAIESDRQIFRFTVDESGFWLGYEQGHVARSSNERRSFAFRPEMKGRVQQLEPDGNRGVWLVKEGLTGAAHLTQPDPTRPDSFRVRRYGPNEGLPTPITTMHRARSGTVYAGGTGESTYFFRFDPERDRFVNRSDTLSFPVQTQLQIFDIRQAADSSFWLASNHGLLRHRGRETRRADVLRPYRVTKATALERTGRNQLWIGTERGVFSYNEKNGVVRRFNEETGLPSLTIQSRALLSDPQNRLWAGTVQGLAYLRPADLSSKTTQQPLLTRLRANSETVSRSGKRPLSLPARATLEVEYAVPAFVKSNVLVQYRLSPSQSAWKRLSSSSPLVLSTLAAGQYTLELRAQQAGFDWSPVTRLRFSVPSPWYLRWWAVSGAILLGLGLIGLLGVLAWNRRAKRRAERALYRSREQYESVVQNVNEAIFQLDRGGTWTFLNPAWSRITGYAVDESLGESYRDFVHPDDRDDLSALFEALLNQEQTYGQCEVRLQEASGEAHWVEFRTQLLTDESGASRGLAGIIVDVQEQKKREQQLIEAKEEAEEMNQLKTTFLANMSHELRTPLTSIIGFARTLSDELPANYHDLVTPIERSGQRLKRTFDSVLNLAELEGETVEIDREPVNVVERVQDTVAQFRRETQERDLSLEVDVPDQPVHAALDPDAFDRILSNLVSNAVKFTPEGRIVVRVRVPAADQVEIAVSDTGVGIEASFQSQVFDEFKQESEGRTRGYQGTGLGLTIVKRLVERMDGTISVESEKGEGSTFTVTVPSASPISS